MNEDKLKPIHPGEVLLEEFLKPMNLSQNNESRKLDVLSHNLVKEVIGEAVQCVFPS